VLVFRVVWVGVWLASTLLLGVAAAPQPTRAQSAALAGVVFDSSLNSPILGREMPYRVYLPPEYISDTTRRFPVMYMLHGAGGNYTEWSDSYLPQQLDNMIERGLVQPMIVVMPDGGERTYFANWDNGPRYSDYIAQDVVTEVDSHFRTLPQQASRAIGGLSMGGYGALSIAMRNPTIFGAVGAHSPSIRLAWDSELWFLTGENYLEQDPIWLSRNGAGVDRMLYWIDVGDEDWWRPNIEELHAAFESGGLNVSWHVFPGTHEAEYWIDHVPDYLRFYSDNLRGDQPQPPPPPLSSGAVSGDVVAGTL
jgi:enterochelin esterase-like enzyme